MILTLDIGNTNIKTALFDGLNMVEYWRISTNRNMSSDEYGILLMNLFAHKGLTPDCVDGIMMSSVTSIINAVTYVLIAFVAISLVVSSIMIGIITYISVLERTREIGVLRSIGASKRDISRVFNAETLTIGTAAGLLGIGVTILLLFPINAIIENLTSLVGAAELPPVGAIVLIGISMLLTFIAGLSPARIAANKDPVVALRTE